MTSNGYYVVLPRTRSQIETDKSEVTVIVRSSEGDSRVKLEYGIE